jgi:hypothetical protein
MIVTHTDGKKKQTYLEGPEQEAATVTKFSDSEYQKAHNIASITVVGSKDVDYISKSETSTHPTTY